MNSCLNLNSVMISFTSCEYNSVGAFLKHKTAEVSFKFLLTAGL